MRSLLLVSVLLLAGCAGSPASPPEPPLAAPADRPETQQAVETHVTSSVFVCPPAYGGCAGVMGSDTVAYDGDTWTGFNVSFEPDDSAEDRLLAGLADVRFVAFCMGERLTCPEGPLATAEGDFPVRLQASGFVIPEPNYLAFRVEYRGALPTEGTAASYRLTGTLTSLQPPGGAEPTAGAS